MSDYISREALLLYLNDIWLTATPTDLMPDDDRHLAIVRCMGLNDAMDAVKDAPAADVRPVVRGRWETVMLDHDRMGLRPITHYCSECHQITWFRTFYCPYCGAKMETEGGE